MMFVPRTMAAALQRATRRRPAVDVCKDRLTEIERLRRVEEDHKDVLKAALYNEPNGVELVNRLTAYALRQRTAQQ